MTADIHTLTGAYAMDALPDEERRTFVAHLSECDACQQEVAELQATAAKLGAASYEAPPAELKAAVLAEIDTVRQEAPPVTVFQLQQPTSRRWLTNLLAPAAAVLVIAVIGLAAIVSNLNNRLDTVEATSTRVADVVAAPGAQLVEADGPDGSTAKVVMAPSRGEALFLATGMPAAPDGHVYELWLIDDGDPVPAGLFHTDPSGRALSTMTGDMSAVDTIAVTIEPAGGSEQPTTDPIMAIEL